MSRSRYAVEKRTNPLAKAGIWFLGIVVLILLVHFKATMILDALEKLDLPLFALGAQIGCAILGVPGPDGVKAILNEIPQTLLFLAIYSIFELVLIRSRKPAGKHAKLDDRFYKRQSLSEKVIATIVSIIATLVIMNLILNRIESMTLSVIIAVVLSVVALVVIVLILHQTMSLIDVLFKLAVGVILPAAVKIVGIYCGLVLLLLLFSDLALVESFGEIAILIAGILFCVCAVFGGFTLERVIKIDD